MSKIKSFFIAFFLFVSFLFVSCNSKSLPSLLGTWETELALKSELGGKEDTDSPQALLFTKQKITLTFAEGGVYTKKIVQNVDRVEFLQDNEGNDDAKAYFSQFFDKNLVFDGEYDQIKKIITFRVLTVKDGDSDPEPYLDYFVKDPSIGDEEISYNYEMKDETLVIDGVSYKKSL